MERLPKTYGMCFIALLKTLWIMRGRKILFFLHTVTIINVDVNARHVLVVVEGNYKDDLKAIRSYMFKPVKFEWRQMQYSNSDGSRIL